jgi:hypothetical protein
MEEDLMFTESSENPLNTLLTRENTSIVNSLNIATNILVCWEFVGYPRIISFKPGKEKELLKF